MTQTTEKEFETHVEELLLGQSGWLRGSKAEWDVNMFHMRVRANLTAEEHKKILEFLKASN